MLGKGLIRVEKEIVVKIVIKFIYFICNLNKREVAQKKITYPINLIEKSNYL